MRLDPFVTTVTLGMAGLAATGLYVGYKLMNPEMGTNAAGQEVVEPTPRDKRVRTRGAQAADERYYQEQHGVGRFYAGPEHARTSATTAAKAIMHKWDTSGADGPDGVIDLRTESFKPNGQTALPFLQHVDKDFGNGDAKVGYDELTKLLNSVDTDIDHLYGGGKPQDGILNEREMSRLYNDHHWFTDQLSSNRPEGFAEGKLVLEAYGDTSTR